MKKPYRKPTLARRDRLSAVTAAVPSSGFTF
ncbi:putative RiPP precursor [Mesorhizobium sp. B3-1-9]|nr:putative RiPP precursor [Mesorhizobium sp. B4-1-1]TPI36067.1 putative RiPP precursor [Mesorhizobium sp. B3-1-6]TPI42012.1 putative RiPP precursor [Mesorhizobium sp. B3-1-9]TPI55846.1 putative RiPP precursor [Mesorhizobium sp. B3-1-7]TPI70778.1 putative RiPP precursor [Mesorhizobium sp. B3-1-8]TPI74465.1 putative RiPP precursor [Mesorhizobium sp. B3-1-3]TPJ32674.1 putative RiPP precursor [Mesorhizobium sp. B2-8-3]TPL49906.1 putative RiPP precursor [Mesorhizobium sp. B2-4-6]